MQVVGFYGLNTSCDFQSARSSTPALAWSQSCKIVMWGWVIQTVLVTWRFKLESCNLHIMCKKDKEIRMSNFAALRAAVFPLSTKNLQGADIARPLGARVKSQWLKFLEHVYKDALWLYQIWLSYPRKKTSGNISCKKTWWARKNYFNFMHLVTWITMVALA